MQKNACGSMIIYISLVNLLHVLIVTTSMAVVPNTLTTTNIQENISITFMNVYHQSQSKMLVFLKKRHTYGLTINIQKYYLSYLQTINLVIIILL